MKRLYDLVGSSVINGILFFIPIGIAVIIFEKIFHFARKVLIALNLHFKETSPARALINNLVIVFFILLICFLAGLFARLKLGKQFIAWLERQVLTKLPGYTYIRAMAEDVLGVPDTSFQQVILFRQGENYQLGFKVETITATRIIIFIPGIPKPRSGAMLIVDKDKVINTDLTTRDALSLMRNMGVGASALLSSYLKENNANGSLEV